MYFGGLSSGLRANAMADGEDSVLAIGGDLTDIV